MELKYTAEEIAHYEFLQAWKVDDKEWLKDRKRKWLLIKDKFTQFTHFKKSNLKFVRNYFLTGLCEDITLDRSTNIVNDDYNQPYFINRYFNNVGLLVAYWLSPDQSLQNWERLKAANCYDLCHYKPQSEIVIKDKYYHGACLGFRRMCEQYEQVERYQETQADKDNHIYQARFTPHKDSDSIFGDELDGFFIKELLIEVGDNGRPRIGCVNQFTFSDLASHFQGYFSGTDFNPNNPLKHFVKEYVKWGIRSNNYEPFWGTYAKVITFAWHIVANPEGYHPLQITMATEFKGEVLKAKDSMPEDAQKNIQYGMDVFESGTEEYFLNEDPDVINEPYFIFCKKEFGIKFY